jgi:hypothetical protein
LESIRKIPQQTRLLYGGIAIGVLTIVLVSVRLFRRNAGSAATIQLNHRWTQMNTDIRELRE